MPRTRSSTRLALAAGVALASGLALACAGPAALARPARVVGTVTTPERAALPPGSTLHVQLVAVSPKGASSTVIGEQIVLDAGAVPIPFEVGYDATLIDPRATYAIQARIRAGGALLFVSERPTRVITGGNPQQVEVRLVRVR
jgi:putative lipoprotein